MLKFRCVWSFAFVIVLNEICLVQGCVVAQFSEQNSVLLLSCPIATFTATGSWHIDNGALITQCGDDGFCSTTSDGNYTFTSDSNGIYVEINPFSSSEIGKIWECKHSTLTNCTISISEPPTSPSGGGGNGSSCPWWIVFIVLVILMIIIILLCCLFNTRCRFRYLLADWICTCTCPHKDTIIIRKGLAEKSRYIGDDIEIQFLDGQKRSPIDLPGTMPNDSSQLKTPWWPFNRYILIHNLQKKNAGKYTMSGGKWQLQLTVKEETRRQNNSKNGKIGIYPLRQNARKTLDPLDNGADGNGANVPKSGVLVVD